MGRRRIAAIVGLWLVLGVLLAVAGSLIPLRMSEEALLEDAGWCTNEQRTQYWRSGSNWGVSAARVISRPWKNWPGIDKDRRPIRDIAEVRAMPGIVADALARPIDDPSSYPRMLHEVRRGVPFRWIADVTAPESVLQISGLPGPGADLSKPTSWTERREAVHQRYFLWMGMIGNLSAGLSAAGVLLLCVGLMVRPRTASA